MDQATLSSLAINLLVFIIGAVVTHAWTRHKRRQVPLHWKAWDTPLAQEIDDPEIGVITVLHNGQPVTNLWLSRVELENDSSRDLQNVEVTCFYEDGTVFLGPGIFDTKQHVQWGRRFEAERAKAGSPPESEYLATHRQYAIPVLNRRCRFSMDFVVQGPRGVNPQGMRLACEQTGVRLVEVDPWRPPGFFGVSYLGAFLWGLAVAGPGMLALIYGIEHRLTLALASFLTGLYVPILGTVVVLFGRSLRRWLE